MVQNEMMELHKMAFIFYWEQWGACILPSDWNQWQSWCENCRSNFSTGEDMGAVEAMIHVCSPTQSCSA